jgi:hypothetical protein
MGEGGFIACALAMAPGDAKCRAVLQNRQPGAKGASGHEIVPHGGLAFFVIYQGRNPANRSRALPLLL